MRDGDTPGNQFANLQYMEFSPLGDSAVLIRFGDQISEATYERIVSFSRYLTDHPFPGMIEHVPAYTTVAIYYDPVALAASGATGSPYDRACRLLRERFDATPNRPTGSSLSVSPPAFHISAGCRTN